VPRKVHSRVPCVFPKLQPCTTPSRRRAASPTWRLQSRALAIRSPDCSCPTCAFWRRPALEPAGDATRDIRRPAPRAGRRRTPCVSRWRFAGSSARTATCRCRHADVFELDEFVDAYFEPSRPSPTLDLDPPNGAHLGHHQAGLTPTMPYPVASATARCGRCRASRSRRRARTRCGWRARITSASLLTDSGATGRRKFSSRKISCPRDRGEQLRPPKTCRRAAVPRARRHHLWHPGLAVRDVLLDLRHRRPGRSSDPHA